MAERRDRLIADAVVLERIGAPVTGMFLLHVLAMHERMRWADRRALDLGDRSVPAPG